MATAINIMQTWLDKAVDLRRDMLRSEAAFFDFLIEGENGACPWRGQYTSFEQLLSSTNLCSPDRYAAYRDALVKSDGPVRDNVESLGVDGVIEAGRISAPKRPTFIARVVEGAKQQGCPLSPRRVKEIGKQIEPIDKPRRGPAKERDAKQLAVENKKLRAENTALRSRVKQLETENAKLRARLERKEK